MNVSDHANIGVCQTACYEQVREVRNRNPFGRISNLANLSWARRRCVEWQDTWDEAKKPERHHLRTHRHMTGVACFWPQELSNLPASHQFMEVRRDGLNGASQESVHP